MPNHPTPAVRLSRRLLPWLMVAASPQAWAGCGPYEVAFYEFGPLYYRNAKGEPAGIDKDLVDELAQRSGCVLKGYLDSRPRIWERLSRGELDITVSGIETPERGQQAEFVPYLRTRNVVLMRKALAQLIGSPEAFLAAPQLTVVVVKRFSHGPYFDRWLDELRGLRRVHEAADFETALRVFRAGRVDLMLSHPITLPRDPEWMRDIERLDWAPQREQLLASLVMSRSRVSAADRSRLRETLLAMLRDGVVDTILQRHLEPQSARNVRLPPAEPPLAR